MKLIDKDALVTEIERMMAEEMALFEESLKDDSHEISAAPVVYTRLQMLLSAINTIEVKDVDLEVELNNWRHNHFHGRRDKDASGEWLERISQLELAKHFFELGLKAQKGEIWQVVDNVNHLQADKNKIYCVFTKDRYILAKVTNHPKDEELLQWKCTEFPHHRYDMCEGDKYMQIV